MPCHVVNRNHRLVPLLPKFLGELDTSPKSRFKTGSGCYCNIINLYFPSFFKRLIEKYGQVLDMFTLSKVRIHSAVFLVYVDLRVEGIAENFYFRFLMGSSNF